MNDFIRKNWALVIAVILISASIGVLIIAIVNKNNGHFVYTMDDTYIHMALAKNLSQHWVWGITPYSFSSCSSSLFWTSIISFIYFIIGLNELTPLVISILCAFMIMFIFARLLNKEGVKSIYILIFLIALSYFMNLPYYAILGLEHTLHALVNVLFIFVAAEIVSRRRFDAKDLIALLVLAVLMPLLRFEGIVSVLLLCALLIFQRRFMLSLYFLLAGMIPISIFGIISISNGWSFFPNSVLIKLNFPELYSLADMLNLSVWIFSRLIRPTTLKIFAVVVLLAVPVFYLYRKYKDKIEQINVRDIVLVVFYAANAVFYYIFSYSSLAARYQHFLVAMAFFVSAILIFKRYDYKDRRSKIITAAAGLAVLISSVNFWEIDSFEKIITTPTRSNNIYEQQYQMAQFVKRYYPLDAVGLNDIGTTSFFTNAKVTDFMGLGDYEASKFRRGKYSKDNVRELAQTRNMKIAIIYELWLGELGMNVIPDEWTKVGTWTINNNIICASETVSIYAVEKNEKEKLIANLQDFSHELPATVVQSGLYTEK